MTNSIDAIGRMDRFGRNGCESLVTPAAPRALVAALVAQIKKSLRRSTTNETDTENQPGAC